MNKKGIVESYPLSFTPIGFMFYLLIAASVGLLVGYYYFDVGDNEQCPSGFTCTKNPEPCWEVVIGNYEMGLVYPQLQNKDSLSEKELTLALYRGVYKNGTEIPRCER